MANDFKAKGNAALQAGEVDKAIGFYTSAIELEPENHIHYSNRSAAFAKGSKYSDALTDAEKCISLKSDWAKGYSRKGAALEYLGKLTDALKVYEEGLKLEPENTQLKQSIESVKSTLKSRAQNGPSFRNPFASPDLRAKLEAHPKTKDYLKQPDFCFMLDQMQKNPNTLQTFLKDPRVMDCLGVLLNIDMDNLDVLSGSRPGRASSNGDEKRSEPEKMEVSSPQVSEVMELKERGNAAYKAKNFDEALSFYDKALELEPINMTLFTNKAAVYFEMAQYQECIEVCEKAIEIGRENRADFKIIAKALARIGNAYWKLNDLNNAKKYFDKSLSEFRAPDVLKRSQELNKILQEKERQAYLDPIKAEEEKNRGNQLFQKGKYPEAMKHYHEAIKRDPTNAKLYSNRAACYTKLMEFGCAVKDCDECIKLEPTFIKGYLRKAAALLAMKDSVKAIECYKKVIELDPNCQEAHDGYKDALRQTGDPDAIRKRAMEDPEVQAILADPGMQIILSQMQREPQAVQEHLKNPEIKAKIRKLMDAGLVSMM